MFIILNLLAINLVSAMNIYNEDISETHLVHSETVHSETIHSEKDSTQEPALASCVDESSCDHFCHIFSHMVGFISQVAQLSSVDTTIAYAVINEPFHTLILDPPFQPPQV